MQTTTVNTDDLSLNHVSNRLYSQSSNVIITSKSKQPLAFHKDISSYRSENKTNYKVGSSNNFKFVSESELNTALKRIRRVNQKKQDEAEWQCFLKLKLEQNSGVSSNNCSSCELCTANHCGSCADCGLLAPISTKMALEEEDIATNEEKADKDFVCNSEEEQCINTSHVYQLGPGLTKRLQDLLATVGKMTNLLLNPNLRSQNEDEDVDRTIKRSLEFDAMFARNHLYEIQRLLKDTKQLSSTKPNNAMELEGKISAALKSITQALQVYSKHVSKGSRVKYQQVVPIFQSITSTLGLLEQLSGQRSFPSRKEIEVSCSYMKQILLEISVTETKSVSSVSQRAVRVRPKHKLSADLSMYSRRHKPDWRRKSAYLARTRFGAPSSNRCRKKTFSINETVDKKQKNDTSESGFTGQAIGSKFVEKTQPQPKEASNTKEVPFRNATRAVPEEQITTMMEMIPNEPMEDGELCLDDNTFEALKLLNGSLHNVPLRQARKLSNQTPEDKAFDLVKKMSLDDIHSAPQGPDSSHTKKSMAISRPKTAGGSKSSLSSARSETEKSTNVQLIFLTEALPKTVCSTSQDEKETRNQFKDNPKVLLVDNKTKDEALWFHQKMTDYQASSPHYKDGKALAIVDRLANKILAEMIIDFQRDEMDQVVRTLYNLEFN